MSTIRYVNYTGAKKPGDFTKVVEGPLREIEDHEILIKAVAYAANPTDWKHSVLGWGGPDAIVGSDVSGTVVKVGKNVTGFSPGDVVSATLRGGHSPQRGAYSDYVFSEASGTIKYPKGQIDPSKVLGEGTTVASGPIDSFEAAASSTLSLGTISCSAFGLGLTYDKDANKDRIVLVWGGATATGIYAIQVFSKVFGLRVAAVASSKNHDYLKSLGAELTFDYKSPSVFEDIRKATDGKIRYALDAVSSDTTAQDVYKATADSPEVTINVLGGGDIKNTDHRKVELTRTLMYTINGKPVEFPGGVEVPPPNGQTEFHLHFWTKVLPTVIGQLQAPPLRVLKGGLESANEALTLLYENKVSAEKLVFRN